MLIPYISGIASLAVCLGVLPIVNRIATRLNLFDPPGPLKIHSGPICRLGGAAMFAGFLVGVVPFYHFLGPNYLVAISVFGAVWAVGLIDDIHPLGSGIRFCVHICAGAALWFGGWRLHWFARPVLDLALTCVFVAFLINAMNLLDGMDGLAVGTAGVICGGFIALSTGEASPIEMIVAVSALGACIAMLTRNAPPAKMFMGDSGSTLLGIVLAFLSLNWVSAEPHQHGIIVPLIFLGVPLADATLAILRRSRSRSSLFTGDRRHFYDLLLQRGYTVRQVFAFSLGITGTLVMAGWLSAGGTFDALIIAALAAFVFTVSAYFLGSLQPESLHVQSDRQQTPMGPALE